MLRQQLEIIKQRLKQRVKKVQWIFGLVIFGLIVLSVFHDSLRFKGIFDYSSQNSSTKAMFNIETETKFLLFYEEELTRLQNCPFLPNFVNHQLSLKLNLTSMITSLFNDFQENLKKKIVYLKIVCLQSSEDDNDFYPICEIELTFYVVLNFEKIRLILLSKNESCSLSLIHTRNMISINIHESFSVDNVFRFTHQWSFLNKPEIIYWYTWPLPTMCLNLFLNDLSKTLNQFSKLNFQSVRQCSLTNSLIHSTSRDLFLKEQNAVSYWLDLHFMSSNNQRLSDKIGKYNNKRRLVPFEISKDSKTCSNEFNQWITSYHQWHENISFIINNGSMTFEEQRNRIIESDVHFLIYEKNPSGIADRITHLISTYLVALLTKRLFLFDKNWPEFLEIMQSPLNYQQELVIPWFSQLDFLNKNLTSNDRNYLTSKTQWFSFDRHNTDYNYTKDFPERILIFRGHTGGVIHTIKSNTSIYRNFLTIDLKMNTDNIFGCLYNSLFTYRLSELIQRVSLTYSNNTLGHSSQQILQTLLSPRFHPIGIQIRGGDHTMHEKYLDPQNLILYDQKNVNRFQNFFKCAQDIIDRNEIIFNKTDQIPIIYLLSDSLHARQSALKRWKFPLKCFQSFENECRLNNNTFHILSNADPVAHVADTSNPILAFKIGMFDSFLFGLCEQHIITTHSGFGRFAVFASLKQQNIYSFHHNEQHSCQNEGISLAISGYHWSGI